MDGDVWDMLIDINGEKSCVRHDGYFVKKCMLIMQENVLTVIMGYVRVMDESWKLRVVKQKFFKKFFKISMRKKLSS